MGGLTGLVRGCTAGPAEIGLSLERMHRIESVDAVGRTMTVQAGVAVQAVQEEAERHGLAYPVDFGARGSAHIGGSVATNAGGNGVIRYGMTRDSVLGLEAVLADGTVISSMNRMIKNNAAYDLKQLFIGTEGTLGVITRVVLRLREQPRSAQTALVACASFADVTALLKHMDASLGGALSAFEVMWNEFYRLVTTPPAPGTPPLAQDHPYYVLLESSGGDQARDMAQFEAALGEAIEDGRIVDAIIATSQGQRDSLWALRDDIEQIFRLGMPVGFDVSLPIAEMEDYIRVVMQRLEREWPAYRRLVFGHLGRRQPAHHRRRSAEQGGAPRHRVLRVRAARRARRFRIRRARDRPGKAAVARVVTQPSRNRADAATEADAGPERHPEPRPRAAGVSLACCAWLPRAIR